MAEEGQKDDEGLWSVSILWFISLSSLFFLLALRCTILSIKLSIASGLSHLSIIRSQLFSEFISFWLLVSLKISSSGSRFSRVLFFFAARVFCWGLVSCWLVNISDSQCLFTLWGLCQFSRQIPHFNTPFSSSSVFWLGGFSILKISRPLMCLFLVNLDCNATAMCYMWIDVDWFRFSCVYWHGLIRLCLLSKVLGR